MPIESQFSLSLELTKFVPLGPIASALGHGVLALARDLRNTGSDLLVEEDLVAIFGRNRIESQFESSFKTVVRESTSKQLATSLDIFLNAGAGPTVRHSLRDSRYFSTIVQLSLLTSVYDTGSLAGGLSSALARRLEGAPQDQRHSPSAQALSGTLRACKEQTCNFNWTLLFHAVSSTLGDEFSIVQNDSEYAQALPVAILQGLIDFLPTLQYFPEDHLVRIKLFPWRSLSIYLIVIWAHHLLGLSVQVNWLELDKPTTFGTGRIQLLIHLTREEVDESICLLDQHDEEVLHLACDPRAPGIRDHGFVPAVGCAKHFIDRTSESELTESISLHNLLRSACVSARYWLVLYGHQDYRARVRNAAVLVLATLFDDAIYLESKLQEIESLFDNLDKEFIDLPRKEESSLAREIIWTMTAFAFVEDIEMLRDVKVARSGLSFAYSEFYRVEDGEAEFTHRYPFFLMAGLLLGNEIYYSRVERCCVFSTAGWSVMTDIFNLPDPVHSRRGMLQVQQGVPTKAGEQKRFIYNLDGYSDFFATISPVVPTPRRLISLIPAAKPGWYVGANENAFEVGIHFHLTRHVSLARQGSPSFSPTSDSSTTPTQTYVDPRCDFVIGLVDLERNARRIKRLPSCQHLEDAMLGSLYEDSENCETRGFPLGPYELLTWKKVVKDRILIIPSAGGKWSRWMAILYADSMLRWGGREDFAVFVRDPNSCPACAIRTARGWLQDRNDQRPRHSPGRVVIVL